MKNFTTIDEEQGATVLNGVTTPDKQAYYGTRYVHGQFRHHSRLTFAQYHESSYRAFCSNYGDHATPAVGACCWNEEAMQGMKNDLSKVWDSFQVDLDAEIERVNATAAHTFTKVCKLASDVSRKVSRRTNNARSAMRTLAGNVLHRKNVMLYDLEQASENFEEKLSTLRENALSSVGTAFVGRLMKDTYHAANMEYGEQFSIRMC